MTQKPQAISSNSALILDRDGTINAMVCNSKGEQDSPYFPSQLELYPHIESLLKPFAAAQIPIFIVTNQPGVAKGHFTMKDLDELHGALSKRFEAHGIYFKDILFCPHHPVGSEKGDPSLIGPCECRKPQPGMLLEIQRKYNIDLSRAIYIGDSKADQGACEAAGVKNFFPIKTFVSDSVPVQKRTFIFSDAPNLRHVLQQFQEL
jgi:D-glycero-D-manno-heptose 1,7-bisphosphate phosphatase